jgi:tricorn protease
MKRIVPLFLLLAAAAAVSAQTLLPQQPALSRTHIVFSYAGDLWSVPRGGGAAIRLTTGDGIESGAVLSPDGTTIAFAGSYDGNPDVFTMPVTGGVPKRLTTHPGLDVPLSFTPDGKQLLIRSSRQSVVGLQQFYTIGLDGGPAEQVPLPGGFSAAYTPDGQRLAYTPMPPAFTIWKRYRGGRTSKVWLAQLSDSKVEEIPRENSNDFNPLATADAVYFLSDRNGAVTLFKYELKSKKVTEAIKNAGLDYKSASLGPGAIVLERFGGIELFDLKSGRVSPVKITLQGDLPGVRPSFDRVAPRISHAALSPSGARAVFEARGEVFTVPAEKGDPRNLTRTPGVAERMPAWSPDGKSIAYLSDESGEYQLHIAPQNGAGEVKKVDLGEKAFYYYPLWSPDSKKILFRDSMLRLGVVELETGKVSRWEGDYYDSPFRDEVNPHWSKDSQWVVYTKMLRSHLRAVFVYSLADGKETQISDGLSDARYARFDKNGKYLYFTASTNQGLGTGWLDMTSIDRPQNRSVYLAVLQAGEASPLAPESDEEKVEPEKKPEPKKEAEKKDEAVRIDFEGISQRILALPVPARPFSQLETEKTGVVYLLEDPPVGAPGGQGPPTRVLHKFDLKTRKLDKVMEGVREFVLSQNGEKMLFRQGPRWAVSGTATPPRPNTGTLNTAAMEMRVDPVAEWKQMYREAWRLQRDYLYAPNFHGLDLAAAEKKVRAVPGGGGAPGGSELSVRGDAGRNQRGSSVCVGRRVSAGPAGAGRVTGRGLRARKRTVPVREGLERRELESAVARAVDATGRGRKGRRVSTGSEREGGAGYGRSIPALRSDGEQERSTEGGAEREWRRGAGGDRGAGGQRAGTAVHGLGGRQPPEGGAAFGRARGLCPPAEHGRGRVHQFQSLGVRANGQGRVCVRRAFQRRRTDCGLYCRPAAAAVVELFHDAGGQ